MQRRLFLAAPIAAVTACVAPPPGNPYPAVPAPRAEFVPPPPRERVVWQPGHWQWGGGTYVWAPGHYVEEYGRRWQAAHWYWDGRRWDWIPGRWV